MYTYGAVSKSWMLVQGKPTPTIGRVYCLVLPHCQTDGTFSMESIWTMEVSWWLGVPQVTMVVSILKWLNDVKWCLVTLMIRDFVHSWKPPYRILMFLASNLTSHSFVATIPLYRCHFMSCLRPKKNLSADGSDQISFTGQNNNRNRRMTRGQPKAEKGSSKGDITPPFINRVSTS